MHIEVRKASIEDSSVLRNLLELYRYDLSELTDSDVDDYGLFGYRYLDHYWTEPERIPFLIHVDGKLAGFVLVGVRERDGGREASIAEFFVMRKYRRRGVGRTVARAYWRDVIAEYTGGSFTEAISEDSEATIQRFTALG